MVVLFSDDLLDASKTLGHARALGIPIRQVKSMAALELLVEMEQPSCCLVDLQLAGSTISELVSTVRVHGDTRVIAYGSHVDAARLKAARDAGCDEVMPRSKFFEEMPGRLGEWA